MFNVIIFFFNKIKIVVWCFGKIIIIIDIYNVIKRKFNILFYVEFIFIKKNFIKIIFMYLVIRFIF